jgi:hypothetical protein
MLVWKSILESLYKAGEADEARLSRAVSKGLITEEEKQAIIAD